MFLNIVFVKIVLLDIVLYAFIISSKEIIFSVCVSTSTQVKVNGPVHARYKPDTCPLHA